MGSRNLQSRSPPSFVAAAAAWAAWKQSLRGVFELETAKGATQHVSGRVPLDGPSPPRRADPGKANQREHAGQVNQQQRRQADVNHRSAFFSRSGASLE